MNELNIRSIRPLKDDVVLVRVPKNEVEGSSGIIFADMQEQNDLQYFEVIAKSDKVETVDVGDLVVVSWKRITDPSTGVLDGKTRQFGVTSQSELLAVIER